MSKTFVDSTSLFHLWITLENYVYACLKNE